MGAGIAWTEEEVSILRDKCKRLNDVELSKFINRTPKSIKKMREKLGLKNVRTPVSSGQKWTEAEDQFLIDNYGKMNYVEMAKYLSGRTPDAIEIRKGKLNSRIANPIVRKASGKKWTKEEDLLLIKNYGLSTYDEMLGLFPGRTMVSLQSRCTRLGFDRDPNEIRRKQRKFEVDRSFFSVPNLINSYIAGFLAADGCVHLGRNGISLALQMQDAYILDEIFSLMGIDCELPSYLGSSGLAYYKYLYVDGVPEWLGDLEQNFNIVPRKSLLLQPPKLEEVELIKSFIRGYIDGDGSVLFGFKTKKKDRQSWTIGASGTYELLSWIKSHFDKWVPQSRKGLAEVSGPHGNIYHYHVSGKRAESIISKLLEVPTPYLKRKWEAPAKYLGLEHLLHQYQFSVK